MGVVEPASCTCTFPFAFAPSFPFALKRGLDVGHAEGLKGIDLYVVHNFVANLFMRTILQGVIRSNRPILVGK